jgi:hypothetical protein
VTTIAPTSPALIGIAAAVGLHVRARLGLVAGVRAIPGRVVRALGGFLVEHAVRMHADRDRRVVLELDGDGVADLGADDRPENAEALVAGFRRLERRVGVFAVDRLVVFAADVLVALRDEHFLQARERLAGDRVVRVRRRVIPDELLGRDVVDTLGGVRVGGDGEKQGDDDRAGATHGAPILALNCCALVKTRKPRPRTRLSRRNYPVRCFLTSSGAAPASARAS